MKKIGNHYILSESEMDKIWYELDLYRKYKIMAELNWTEQADEKTVEMDV